ncbi:uncharacterized protein EV420DRAFT_776626 [Desarmillaria tabescens]|uniref:F-box domain-containing protein n=1 Tax=Armillaria tabescens TaxID=1929756 RepID=A0AA39JZQ8_ARMTA|nr:uncharacterized protein EV420DRAFT_776626 [Desarmillaria tabescens]KAK0449578.1 hypothetical protein EV420DRAFT_776626 [Desarmillaria tabescens]
MDIPEDVLEEILRHLSSDFPSLKACSLSHSFFLPSTRRLLFSYVKLPHNKQISHTDICLNFRQTLVASKYVLSSIRTLSLIHWDSTDDIDYRCIFPSLLELIPNLRRVHIFLAMNRPTIFGDSFPPPPHSISSVRHLILEDTVFNSSSQMLSLFVTFSNLEVISMNRISIDNPSGVERTYVSSHRCAPSTLELRTGGAPVECLLSPQSTISIGNLRVLSVQAFERNIDAISSLISLSSPSLEHLTFLPSAFSARYDIDLRGHLRLRSICTSLVFNSHSMDPPDRSKPFPWAHRFFKTLPSSVEDIFIEICFRPYDAILLPRKRKEWQELDHILANHPWNFSVRLGISADYTIYFSNLEYDDVIHGRWPTNGDMDEYFRNYMLVDGMPKMNKLGRLNCEITTSEIDFSPSTTEMW